MSSISIEVTNLTLNIPAPKSLLNYFKPSTAIQILHNLNFKLPAGQFVAILGASGSGKTSLLNILSLMIDSPSVKFKGLEDGSEIAYVQQHDFLSPYLTVRENLRYMSELRMESHLDVKAKYERVERVIRELGLMECSDTIVGDSSRGISGGQKRRLTVALSLLTDPKLLVLDEASTGLDAFTTHSLCETLKALSRGYEDASTAQVEKKKGRMVIMTVHQPRSDVIELIDTIIVMAKGSLIYVGRTDMMVDYFKSLGHSCPEDINPADYVIDLTAVDSSTLERERESVERVDNLVKEWKAVDSSLYEFEGESQVELKETKADKVLIRSKGANYFNQFSILTRRSFRCILRDNMMLYGNLVECIVIALLFGAIFYRLADDLSGVITRRAAIYIVAAIQTYLQLIFVVYRTGRDLVIFDRERADKSYAVVPYVFGQFFAQFLPNVFFPTLYSLIIYFIIGFRTDNLALHLFRFILANVLANFVVVAFSLFAVSIKRDFAAASLIANGIFTFFSFSAGFFIKVEAIPVGLRWIASFSFLTFQFKLLASNEFSNNVFACADAASPCLGNNILQGLGVEVDDYTRPILGLVINFAVFMVLATLILQFLKQDGQKHAPMMKKKVVAVADEIIIAEEKDSGRQVEIRFQNVSLELQSKAYFKKETKTKLLLNKITTVFSPGSLNIIMGPSGSGKTTLLNLLCGRTMRAGQGTKVVHSGTISYNGKVISSKMVTSICSFVLQSDDFLLAALTTRETLEFAARLRLPESMTRQQKEARADEVLNLLGLRHCASVVVGGEMLKGLSGGEKRRLSIGIQLITNPAVLVIDEPTSGLDAFTAHQIMKTLKAIAMTGRTVICSIHQPRSDIFTIFDDVLLLARGGQVAYSGPAKSILSHFASLDLVAPKYCNPADFILDVTSVDIRSLAAEESTLARVNLITSTWADSNSSYVKDLEIANKMEAIVVREVISSFAALPILIHRSYLNSKRQPSIAITRILQTVTLGVIISLYYVGLATDQTSIQSRIGLIQQTLSVLFVGLLNCVAVFPAERNLLFYEYADRSYTVAPFMLSYMVIEVPVEIISSFLFTSFVMVLVGLRTSYLTYFSMSLTVFCLVNLGESIGIVFCSFVEHIGLSLSLTNALLGAFTQMGGLLSSNMPAFLDGINRLSPVPYFTRLLMINEFSNSNFTCTALETNTGLCLYHTGADVLRLQASNTGVFQFDVNQFNLYIICGVLLTIAYRVLAYLALSYRASQL